MKLREGLTRRNRGIVVSRAFQVLSDAEKKDKYDRFGGDPDNRFGPGAAPASSPFSGFAARSPGGRGPMFEDEISPEELFNRFFGGGGGMGGGPFGRFLDPGQDTGSLLTLKQAAEFLCLTTVHSLYLI